MEKKSRELEILNARRIALIENLETFNFERTRIQGRLNNILDHIERADMELAALDTQLAALAKKENFDIKLHIVHGEHDTNNPKLMIEIILENHPPIFKLLSQFDVLIYSGGTTPTDKLQLKSRLIEVVEEWLSEDRSISKLFSDSDDKLENALENYLNDSAFERKIRRAAALFPVFDA